MKYRMLGKSGIEVSSVALGCMSLGVDRARAERILRRALDLGVTLFDTADIYDRGVNEERWGIGRVLTSRGWIGTPRRSTS